MKGRTVIHPHDHPHPGGTLTSRVHASLTHPDPALRGLDAVTVELEIAQARNTSHYTPLLIEVVDTIDTTHPTDTTDGSDTPDGIVAQWACTTVLREWCTPPGLLPPQVLQRLREVLSGAAADHQQDDARAVLTHLVNGHLHR